MKTDYAAHEQRYREILSDDRPGWDDAEQLADHLAELPFYEGDGVPGSGRLLELGCGAGDVALVYAACGYSVFGLDIAPTAVRWARDKAAERGLGARFVVGDVRALPYHRGAFDVVVDGHLLHCIIGPDRARVLGEVRRVLRPGGAFLLGTMCGEVTSPRILEGYDRITRCHVRGDVASRYFGEPDAILGELGAAGLEVARWTVKPRRDDDDQDMLLAVARPAT